MVSGCVSACCNAKAMASRTPKHMPRCSARMIFIFPPTSNAQRKRLDFVTQSRRPNVFISVQKNSFPRFGLLNDLFEQVDVGGEGFAALGCERIGRQWPAALKGLGHRGVAGLVQ